jgi:hypothetical protein
VFGQRRGEDGGKSSWRKLFSALGFHPAAQYNSKNETLPTFYGNDDVTMLKNTWHHLQKYLMGATGHSENDSIRAFSREAPVY